MLDDELKRDPVQYDKWYEDFSQFLKEGLMMDQEHNEALMKLMRYNSS